MSNDKPVHEMRLGRVKAVIWRNESDMGVRYNIKFARLYRAGDQWASTESFRSRRTDAVIQACRYGSHLGISAE